MKKYSNGRVGKKYMGRFAAVILAVAVLAGCGEKNADDISALEEENGQTAGAEAETGMPGEQNPKSAEAAEAESGEAPKETSPEDEMKPTDLTGESASDARIDFQALKAENPEIFAWLYIPDTAIDYPVLQSGQGDDFYESHNACGETDEGGAIYIELANLTNMCDFNTVMHGKTGPEGSGLFADLYRFADLDFFREHEEAYVYLDGNVLTYEIIAAYERENTSLLRSYDFTYPEGCEQFLEDMYGTRDMTMNLREGWEGITPYHFLLTLTTRRDENADRQFVVVAIMTGDAAGTIDRIVEE